MMNLLEFAILLLIDHKSRTQGAFLEKLYDNLKEFGFDNSFIEIQNCLDSYIRRGLIFEIDSQNVNEIGKRLFFIKKEGKVFLEENNFDRNFSELQDFKNKNMKNRST